MAFGIIYKVKNILNGKVYIGQTIEGFEIRKRKHYGSMNYYSKENRHFSLALKKYPKDIFIWSVVENCDSKEELDEMEFHYITQYEAYTKGYNMTLGGEGVIGHKHSSESKKKMSLAKKGKPSPRLGVKASKETRIRQSIAAKNRATPAFSEEHCRKISKAKLGHKVSEEARKKISESLKKRYAKEKIKT